MSETVSSLFSPSLPSSFYRLLDSERDSGRRASSLYGYKRDGQGRPGLQGGREEWWHNIRLNLSYIPPRAAEISVRRWSSVGGYANSGLGPPRSP